MTYPNAIQFTSKNSVSNQGLLDLTISYNNKVIAKNGSKNFTIGGKVLVFSREHGTGLHVYSAVIKELMDYPSSVWLEHGGKLFTVNYTIEPTSEVVYLTEAKVKTICAPFHTWQIANAIFMGGKDNVEPIGKPRARLVEYLETNHPV
tara:strand:- start:417 stop:860 length:444 start_codon:yes stop_codon:yes gene_type:complete